MKTSIACMGRFHAFYLAAELDRRGALERLYTSYPSSRVEPWGVSLERTRCFPSLEVFNRGLQWIATYGGPRLDQRWRANRAFDSAVAKRLTNRADLFVGWSGAALHSIQRARELGVVSVLERGSSHILHQQEVLSAEYGRVGVRGRLADPRIVQLELAEYAAADFIAVPTEYAAETFRQRGVDPAKLLRIPYGVNLDAFQCAPPTSTDGRFRILHCGNVSLRKGCHHLLEAFLAARLPDAELHFVGSVARDMRSILAAHADKRVFVHGHVAQEKLVEFYQRSSVFCLASLEEGMAMVIAQALACGLPVVATGASGAAEVLRDGVEGWLFDAGDVTALSAHLRRCCDDPSGLRAVGARAALRVRSGFSWSDYGERALAAYTHALASKRGASSRHFTERAA